jgi:uncharacterized repeat protein (TIGR01451 family)/fimbrial isopeptide formation D2 family protein
MRLTGLLPTFLHKSLKTLGDAAGSCDRRSGKFFNPNPRTAGSFSVAPPPRCAGLGVHLLILLVLLLGISRPVQAATVLCSDFGGVVDGYDAATFAAIESSSTFGIDMNCTVKNFPESVGGFPITNINFNFPQQQSYYIVFDNVYYYGNMSCNDPSQSDFWIYWAPGGFTDISSSCQAFMVPVDAVLKSNPLSQSTAAVGVPFTYTIRVPVLGQQTFLGFQYLNTPDSTDISNIVIVDDLTVSGADLSYVGNTAYAVNSSGARTATLGSLNLGVSAGWLAAHPGVTSDTTKHLVFSYENNPATLSSIPAGTYMEIDVTVVLDSSPAGVNPAGTLFTNTAKMWFDKTINSTDIFGLQAEPGTTQPLAIIEPDLVVTKTSPVTNLNLGTWAPYTINVQNTGGSDAWNATITDNLPAGMCVSDPTGTVTARVFTSDGVTPVSGALVSGTDFSLSWNGGSSSACQLSLQMLTDAAKIGPTEHLIIGYEATLDSGISSGSYTNVAGATQWFSADSGTTGRRQYDRTLTDGTTSTLDFQDAYTITAAATGYYFLKSVDNLTTGASPAASAFAGDRLRYTLQLQNFNIPTLHNITITDNLSADFVPGSLSLAGSNLPVGASVSVDATGGTNGTGLVTISNFELGSNTQYQLQFDVTLDANLSDGTVVQNQASITGDEQSGISDDPYVGGPLLLGASGDITSVTVQAPGALLKTSPTPDTATIGEQFTYTITVPAIAVNVPLYDVEILDMLPSNVSFVSARLVSSGIYLSGTGTAPLVIRDTNTGIDIPAGGQAQIEVTVALQNIAANFDGVPFTNSASYTYNKLNGGDSSTQGTGGTDSASMTVAEPQLTAVKTVSYISPAGQSITVPADAGDILQYEVTLTNAGGVTAYDADILDTLPSNVELVAGSVSAQINSSPVSGFLATPSPQAGGALAWGNLNGDPGFDIPAGGNLVLTYQVRVLSADGMPINNSVYGAWTSLNGETTDERTGDGCPNTTSPDDYCTGPVAATPVPTIDPTALVKAVVSDTWDTGLSTGSDARLRIGDTVIYSLTLTLREGTTQDVRVTDALDTGLAYDGLVSISPASGSSSLTYTVASQPTPGAAGTLTWILDDIINLIDNDPANNTLVIQYRAKVIRDILAQTPTIQALDNDAALNYAINGLAATPQTSGADVSVRQPLLSVSKSAAPAGGDTVISAGETITYTVDITNNGDAPAYNPVLVDTLPAGLRTALSTTAITLAGTPMPLLGAPYFSYNSTTGVATWNFDNGVAEAYAIDPGETLQVVYDVTADTPLAAGMLLVNSALVQHYYSFDSQDVPADSTVTDRQHYGPTGAATTQLTTTAATALSKQALVSTAAIGQPFTYEITIPASPQPTVLYDVRVLDNLSLALTGVTMSYVSASAHLQSGAQSWAALTNSGTATNLILEDSAGGLDIPAGDQLVVDVTVVLNDDTVNNTLGKTFQNAADYTYHTIDNDPTATANGAPGASGPVTIVGPDLTLQKSGPATMRIGVPGDFELNVQNIGTGTAWNTTLTDLLPRVTSPMAGGMCDAAPANITARIYQSDGTTAVSPQLVNGTDFTVGFTGAPACTWTVTMAPTADTAIGPTQRLIVRYQTSLDADSASGLSLTNIAGAIRYLSADPAATGASGNIHTHTNSVTDGTPGTLDFQDAFTVTTESPVLVFTKTATNVTTGQSGATASPGDTLKYTVTIQNISMLNALDFTLTDELDRLNSSAMFEPGSLTLITVPSGADTSLTSATGGAEGTGLVSIGSLDIDIQGTANDTLVIEFQATLAPVITSGTQVLNQAQIGSSTLPAQLSDDPSIGGTADPTPTTIVSAPAFRFRKTVRDLTSGTATVMAGDTLRYTLRVNNTGTENATGVTLRDLIPANTTYVAGSTTLNGAAVADPGAGVSALQNGVLINSPANPTAGVMPADAAAAAANTATITFDVQISTDVVDGTIISNQGFINGFGAGSGPFNEQPSDDPATPVTGDPTSVVVGNVPLVIAQKTVALVTDNNGNGLVDPDDVLRYTITLTNSAATPATGVVLTDGVPANTIYVAGTTTLNGGAVADPGAGVSQLAGGMGVVSSGLTPPSPASGGGTLAAHGTGTVTFDVRVNLGVLSGTQISNQGSVSCNELPSVLTDADGLPANGFQPTVVVVGDAQVVSVIKNVAIVGGGTAQPGGQLEYEIRVTNIGSVAATSVEVADDLGPPLDAQVSYVTGSGTLNGSAAAVTYAGNLLTASCGDMAAGSSAVVRFRVQIAATVTEGTTITNTGVVSWNSPVQTDSASVTITVGGTPGSIALTGNVWHDANLDRFYDSTETRLADWTVALYQNNQLLATTTTDTDGAYRFSGLRPNQGTTDFYVLRFTARGAGPNAAALGYADSIFTNAPHRIRRIVGDSGAVLQNLNLPIQPNGTVYNSVVRVPVVGARLAMLDAATGAPVSSSCFDDPNQQNQVTAADGFYKFDLNFSDGSCPAGGAYLIQVTSPATGYLPAPSRIIPPASDAATAPFPVPACPGSANDADPATSVYCEAVASPAVPPVSDPPGSPSTTYYLHLLFSDGSVPGQSQIFNNPIPVDPVLDGATSITKTAADLSVCRGDMVPYTITVSNVFGAPLYNISIIDRFPAGFKYVAGSARLNGDASEPTPTSRELVWNGLDLQVDGKITIKLLLVAGSGVSEGEYVNRALVFSDAINDAVSGEASATVRVVPDPDFDCTDVFGKVFDDRDLDGSQDPGENGLGGVRVVTARGLITTSDELGRFHITCATVPDQDLGSNFILKLDERSLPTGYRLTTENPRVQRATRGKMLRFNFGATIHRVLRLDISDGVFEDDSSDVRLQWIPRIATLLDELREAPSVLRLSYLADVEGEDLVNRRLEALKMEITGRWDLAGGGYPLSMETEIFWRRGAPVAGQ